MIRTRLADLAERIGRWDFAWIWRQRAQIEQLESRMLFSFTLSGAETRLNTNTTYAELNPVIATDGSGNFVAVWSNNGQDGNGWGVYGQRFNASGTPVGAEFRINQTTIGDQTQPAVAMNSSGSFIVTWVSSQNSGDIYARQFDSSGTPTGNEFLVSATTGVQKDPTVGLDSNGDFTIAWDGQGSGDTQAIFSQSYVETSFLGTGLFSSLNASGVHEVNTTIDHQQHNPTITMDGGGAYVIAWTDDNSVAKIKARRGTAAGGLSGSEFLVGTSGAVAEDHATAGVDSSGNFAIAWQEHVGGSAKLDVEARRYNSSGTALDAAPIVVNTYTADDQQNPALSMRSDGSFLVAWESTQEDGNQGGVYAQAFNSNGTTTGGEFLVNTTTNGNQENPSTVWVGSNAVIAWDGQGVGDSNGIFAQRLTVSNAANVAPAISLPSSQSVAENAPLTLSSANGNAVRVSDSDAGTGVEEVQLIPTNGTLTLASTANVSLRRGTGTGDTWLIVDGSLGNLNAAINGLVFTPTSNFIGAAQIDVWIDDLGNSGTGGAMTTMLSLAITVNPVAHTPSITATSTNENTQTSSGLVISPNALDASMAGFLQISGITGGSLFQSDGTTAITNGQFITFAQGGAGLRFAPTANSTTTGSFNIQASTSSSSAGLGGSIATASITISPVPLVSAPASATTPEDSAQAFSGTGGNAISVSDPGNPGGTATIGLTATHGTLTLAGTNGVTFVTGGASGSSSVSFSGSFTNLNAALNGLQFVPAAHYSGNASLAASVSEGAASANTTVALTVSPVAHTPSITNARTVVNQQTTAGLAVSRNAIDGAAVGFIKITGITGGTLFQQDGVTAISNGDFITVAQGNAGLRFTPTPGSIATGAFTIQASTIGNDSGLGGAQVAAAIAVAGPPVNQVPAAQTIAEDASLIFSSTRLFSVDDPSIGSGADSIVVSVSHGTVTLAGSSGVTLTSGTGTGDASVSFTGSLPRLRAALNGLTFTPDQHFFGAASVQMVTTDPANTGSGGALSDTDAVSISVNRTAHQPFVTPAQAIETSQTTTGLVITPNSLDASLSGFFKITSIVGGSLFLDDGTTAVTEGQFITFAQGQAGLKFTPAAGSNPSGSFQIQASTTSNDTGLGGSQVAATIFVIRQQVIGVESDALSYTEGQGAAHVSPGLTLTDTNGISLTGATVRLIGTVPSEDTLAFTSQNGITGSWDGVLGVLTLTGVASPATYQTALQSVSYVNLGSDPSSATRVAEFTVADSAISSSPSTRSIQVTPVNNAPVISSPTMQSTVEAVALIFSSLNRNRITFADVDSQGQPEQLTLTATNGTIATSSDPSHPAGSITLTATLSSLAAAMEGLVFTPSLNYSGPATITIRLDDLGNTGSPGPQSAEASIAIDVLSIAHTPSVTDAQVAEGHRSNALLIVPNAADLSLAGYFKITGITGGTLVQHNGVTPINDGDFITFAQAQAGPLFTPAAGSVAPGSFTIQASVSNSDAGLGGSPIQASIAVIAAALLVRRASVELPNSGAAAITTQSLYVVAPTGAAEGVTYVLLALPQHGTLLLNGTPMSVNDSFTRDDLDRGTLSYLPSEGVPLPDRFQFQATDDAGRSTGAVVFQFKRQPVPIMPALPAIPTPTPSPVAPSHGDGALSDLIAAKTSTDDSSSNSNSNSTSDDGQTSAPASSDTGGESPANKTDVSPAAAPAARPVPKGASAAARTVAAAAPNAQPSPARAASREINRDSVRAEFVSSRKLLAGNSAMWVDLDAMKKNMHSEIKVWAGTASFVSIGMSLAYFMWILRAGSLLSGLLSSMPAWNFVDPLPILESIGSARRIHDDDEGLEGLVSGYKNKS